MVILANIDWGNAPDWVQAIGVVVGFIFAVVQLRRDALANKVTAFLSIVEHLQAERVREARKTVHDIGRKFVPIKEAVGKNAETEAKADAIAHPYENWSPKEKAAAQLVQASNDVAAATLRLANTITAYLSIVEHSQAQEVREARKKAEVDAIAHPYENWSPEEKAAAQLVGTSYDVAAAALRYGAFDLNQFAKVWKTSVLELAPIIQPHIDFRRQEVAKSKAAKENGLLPEEYFENYSWLVDSLRKT